MVLKQALLSLPSDLVEAITFAYNPCNLICKNFEKEKESAEYGAFTFEMNDRRIKFRMAKITPTKIGQFVTLWKRIGDSEIMPYDREDPIDFFIVSVRKGEKLGQFVFSKKILVEKDIVSNAGKGGKRAMRVYPPWDRTESSQAKKTQVWQSMYFFEISADSTDNIAKFQQLLQLT